MERTYPDLKGNSVAFEPGSMPSAKVVQQMRAVADEGQRFRAPSVGLNVPLGAMTMVDNTITPPGFRSAYRVRNLGVSLQRADHGTVFVAMHSLRGGAVGPGNYLIDVARARARITKGAQIDVGDRKYIVTGTQLIKKTELGSKSAVWRDKPGRLVVITCLQRAQGGPSVDNVVLYAQLAGTN